jgi:hypothetical protein
MLNFKKKLMTKKTLLISLLLLTFTCISQERRTIIRGKVTDSISTVKNANIINIKSNQGTFSSDNGEFTLFVRKGDSLRISSIQHITQFILIRKKDVNNKFINLKLTYNTVSLDTFELKRHNLSGRLGIDSKSVPTDRKDSLLSAILDFSKMNMNIVAPDDHIDTMKPSLNNVDPTARFAGLGASGRTSNKSSARLWALRRELARKEAFPYKIMAELGEKFFFKQLKIPVERYFHFLEYCNFLNIEDLHKDKKMLDIIKIFETESKTYLKIIKKE